MPSPPPAGPFRRAVSDRSAPWRRAAPATAVLAFLVVGTWPAIGQAQGADPYYEFLLARHLRAEGDDRGALQALQRAAVADPLSAEVRAEIALLHLGRNERADAEKAAQAALVLDVRNVEANRVLGQIYTSLAETERPGTPRADQYLRDAIRHFEVVVAGSGGGDPQLQFLLGRLYMASGDPAKAIQTLGRVVTQSPGSAAARLSLAQAYAATADLGRAIETLLEIVEGEPRVAAALGEYLERAGRFAEAADSYSLALRVQPDSRELKHRRAVVLHSARDYERAAAFAAQAHREHPDDLRFARLEARARFDAGQREAAITQLEGTARAYPRDNLTQFALVDLYQEGQRGPDAERLLRQMLAVDSANPQALNYLGYLLALRGEQLDEAIALVRRALDADPDNGAYLDSLGWAHFRRGDLDEAEKYLTAAAERMPNHAEIIDHLGDLQARRGRWADAIRTWTRALAGEGTIDRAAIQQKIEQARAQLPR